MIAAHCTCLHKGLQRFSIWQSLLPQNSQADAFVLKWKCWRVHSAFHLELFLYTTYFCSPDIIFINELEKTVSSEVMKSPDDMKLFKIKMTGDHYEELHRECMRLSDWAMKWKMKFSADKWQVIHVRKKTVSFLYKMMGSEVTINATKLRLVVMRDRPMEKCAWYLPDGKMNNQPTKKTSQQIKPWDLLGNWEQNRILNYVHINSWVTLMLSPQSIQSAEDPPQFPFVQKPELQGNDVGQLENKSRWEPWSGNTTT